MSYDPFEDLDDNMFHDYGSEGALEEPLVTIDQHIDTFIQTGEHGWDMSLFTFDKDPTYDVEGSPQTKDWSPCIYDSDVWDGDGDMIMICSIHLRMTCHNIFRVMHIWICDAF
jgi:hypothetical protein